MKCPRCGTRKVEAFYASTIARRGHNSECKKCHKTRTNINRKLKPEYGKKYAKLYRAKNGEYLRDYARRFNAWNKQIVFDYYGRVCVCCGMDNPAFLSIDHINNDGYEDRRDTRSGTQFYTLLVKQMTVENKFRDDLQTLCFNCNFGKNANNGVCPHKGGKKYERVEDPRSNSLYAVKASQYR